MKCVSPHVRDDVSTTNSLFENILIEGESNLTASQLGQLQLIPDISQLTEK